MARTSYNLPNHAHYLTFSCYRRQQLLSSVDLCPLLVETWDDARCKGDFAIWSYVIMPEHVHLLIYPRQESYEMSDILRLLKEGFTHKVVAYWKDRAPHMLERIRIQRGKRTLFRFWQEGGGYDRNLHNWGTIRKAIDYVEWNPVRRGIVNDPCDWEWSSARARNGKGHVPLSVEVLPV